MNERSEQPDWESLRAQLIGVGETSAAKSYYPSLRRKANELERFRVLVDESHDAILLLDARRGSVIDLNRQAAALLGVSKQQARETDVASLFPAELARHLEQMSADPDAALRTDIALPGNESLIVEISARSVDFHGDRYIVLVARDVTLRRQAQDELEREVDLRTRELQEALDRLRKASDAKSQFLASMSHELRTPLNSIIGFSSMMLEGMSGPVPEEQRVQLTHVLKAGKHLLALINEVLDLSRIEAGKIKVNASDVAIDDIVDEAMGLVSPLAHEKDLPVDFESGTRGLVIHTDEERVRQILLNLLSNALKFTDSGAVTVSSTQEGSSVRVQVADTGPGIPSEGQDRIWEPFQQLSAVPDRQKGTGLGLGIARHLALLLGGDITLESVLGEGSTFTLVLPLRYEPATL